MTGTPRLAGWAGGLVAGLALAGCGTTGAEPPAEVPATTVIKQVAISAPPSTPATTRSATPTAVPPTPTPTAPGTSSPSQSQSPTDSATPSESTPTATETDTATPTDSDPASASTSPDAADSGDGALPIWFGLAALAAAGGTLAWFLVAGSRRRGWDDRLDVEGTQAQWVADELVPALVAPATPSAQVSQHWTTAQETLDQLETNLADLVTDAPDDARALRATSIASAVTQVRSSAAAHVALTGVPGVDPQAQAASAAALQTATDRLVGELAQG